MEQNPYERVEGYWSAMLAQLMKTAKSYDISVVSTDVFDTLLLRGATSERRRFYDISNSVAAQLARENFSVDAETLLRSRLDIQTAAYRAVESRQIPSDVSLRDLIAVQAKLLHLPEKLVDVIVEVETEADLATLKPNHRLISELWQLQAEGKTIIATSDTYYSASQLAVMMSRLIGAHPISRIYSSCDCGATKKSGRLYQIVSAAEKCPTHRILHLGDDKGADIEMATLAGIVPVYTPRRPEVWMRRKLDAMLEILRRTPKEWRAA